MFNKRNEHLGLWQCTDIKETAEVNVKHRLNKTDKKTFKMMGTSLGKAPGMGLDTSKFLYNTNIKPSMIAGIQAIHITNESLKMRRPPT